MANEPLRLEATALLGMREIAFGEDLARAIADASASRPPSIGDVLVVAQKVVSKAERRVRRLAEVTPTAAARELAAKLDKDPRLVQVVLDESETVIRAERGVLITRTRQGYVCANAGVDASNVPGDDVVTLLPEDSDASARRLRRELAELLGARPAVVIADSFGRPWRVGQVDVALGCAGLRPLDDRRGQSDALGRELSATVLAVADEAAAAASLVRRKHGREAVVLLQGLERFVTEEDGAGAAALLRPVAEDLFDARSDVG